MINYIKTEWDKISAMTILDRNTLLCKLVVKEHLNTIMVDEIIQLEIIQTIRTLNGEIDQVLKNWEANPELYPRKS